MTRLTFLKSALVLVALLISFRGLTQSATFSNGFPCDVELLVEEHSTGGTPCLAHYSQPVIIPAGSSVPITFQPATIDICIIIVKIGSCTVNHPVHLNSWCHGGPLTTSGSVLASCCPGISATWNASYTPMSAFNIW